MALRLLRASSTVPNITNINDSAMARFAYGGYDGIDKSRSTNPIYTIDGGVFKLNTIYVIVQGWEIFCYGDNILDLSDIAEMQYHTVYLEVDINLEKVALRSTYSLIEYPEIDPGDNLSYVTQGTARLPLFTFIVQKGVIRDVKQIAPYIPFLKDIEERLEKLGFREGVVTLPEGCTAKFPSGMLVDWSKYVTPNVLRRQGNYVIGIISHESNGSFPAGPGNVGAVIGYLPADFIPPGGVPIFGTFRCKDAFGQYTNMMAEIVASETGELIAYNSPGSLDYVSVIVTATIGYEAAPL